MKLSAQLNRARRAGFTLAEMMVVIVIIGLLATLVVPNVVGFLGRAMGGKVKSDINAICNALDNYALQNATQYPESLEELINPPEGQTPFLKNKQVPLDPWKMPYQYDPPSSTGTGEYRVYSLGKDKSVGGTGDDADIDNWTLEDKEE
jgi:general secretion pathway protein G